MNILCEDVLKEIIDILQLVDVLDFSLTCKYINKLARENVYFKMFIENIKCYDCEYHNTLIIKDKKCYKYNHDKNNGQDGVAHKIYIDNIISVSSAGYYSILLSKNGIYKVSDNLNERINLTDVISVSCGVNHTIFLTKYGLYGMGSNIHGQLGINDYRKFEDPVKLDIIRNIEDIIQISCGLYHSLILTCHGLYGFGSDNHAQLSGIGFFTINVPHHIKIYNVNNILSVHCNNESTLLVTNNNILTFGCNKYGQLGQNNNYRYNYPNCIDISNIIKDIISISYKCDMCLMVTNNTLYGFGRNDHKQLKDTKVKEYNKFIKIIKLKNLLIESVCCGKNHIVVKTDDGYYNVNKDKYTKMNLNDVKDIHINY